ncbi:MAG: hypothetical protein NUV69_03805, partial [Candidatus Curtissbacteria bacterium]|nr:hypothetical protein [Candidatus Curtissbacteria bacterium]
MPFVRSPFVLITLLLIGTLIFFRMNDSPIRDQGASSNKAAVPEKTGEGGAVESVKKFFEDGVEGTKEKVTTAVEQKKDDAVSKVLGKQKNDVDVNVLTKEEGETITPDKVFTL